MIGTQVGPFAIVRLLVEAGLGKVYLAVPAGPPVFDGYANAPGSPRELADAGTGSRYQLGEKLGSGGMAEVFAGTMIGAEGFARPVAIKRVLTGLSQVPAFAKMFVAEAQIASRLAHPNIVSVLDFSRDPEDRLFLVMEYVDGKNLASLLDAGPIPPSLALFIIVELLRGLGYAHDLPHCHALAPPPGVPPHSHSLAPPHSRAVGPAVSPPAHSHAPSDPHCPPRCPLHCPPQAHALAYPHSPPLAHPRAPRLALPPPRVPAADTRAPRGVIHRDVSPQNLLISYEGAVKVSDFGLAKVRAASDGVWSETVRGKPSYMSPEQAAGEMLDGRTDLYAVGVMLWEMLAHRPLFAGTTREILSQVMFKDIAAPSSVRSDVPVDLETVAMKLLARGRDDRYATAEAAIEALLRCDDVPRDGRGDLAHLLAERFPRASGSRSQRKTGAAPGGMSRAPRAEQITALALPSVPGVGGGLGVSSALDRAACPSIPAVVRPRRGVFAAVLSGVAVVVAVALLLARGEPAQPGAMDRAAPPRGGPPEPRAALRVAAATSVMGGEVAPTAPRAAVPAVAVRAPDSAPAAAPVAHAPSRPAPVQRERGRAAPTGELAIIVKPWAMIWLNGKPSGQTPFRAPVPAGRYRVRLVNDDIAQNETTTVTVEPGQTATVERNW